MLVGRRDFVLFRVPVHLGRLAELSEYLESNWASVPSPGNRL
jgi:hypothetical protein